MAASGIDFNAVLMDVTITSDQTNGRPGTLSCPWAGPHFEIPDARQRRLQDPGALPGHRAGTLRRHRTFRPFFDYGHLPEAKGEHLGRGWTWLRTQTTGFDKQYTPSFSGQGRMKLALALPYFATGDHGDAYVWAGSVGRYTHSDTL